MISHEDVLLACRLQLESLSVATTGAVSIEATSTGYARSTGSFVTDGFAVGMELVGTSFSNADNNAAKVITAVSALTITAPGTAIEASATRTLSVGVPEAVSSENVHFEPETRETYFAEQYTPGPMDAITLGPGQELEVLPNYIINVYVPSNTAISGAFGYVDALLTLFAPGTNMPITDSTLRVRRDVAPFAGQLIQLDGFAVMTVTIPLRVRTPNSI